MLSRIMIDPLAEMRAMDEMFDRMFGQPFRSGTGQPMQAATLPVDILERDGNLVVRAAIPGVRPEDLDVSIDNNVLTIKGETHTEHEDKDAKIYRREVSYGSFARSIRLPDNLNLENVDAEFKNGHVTITIPRLQREQPKPLKVNVRSTDGQNEGQEKALIEGSHQKNREQAEAKN